MPRTATKRNSAQQGSASTQPAITLRGTIIRRRFYNADNGYCVLSVDVNVPPVPVGMFEDSAGDTITCVGNMPSIREGGEYSFTGTFKENAKWGRQFAFTASELIIPSGRAGVARYLSQVTHGVGLVKADRIVNALGEDALEKIKSDPGALSNPALSFLTPQQREDIVADLLKNSVQADLAGVICVPGTKIGMKTVTRIMSKYGAEAVDIVKQNPYILSSDLFGVGFKKADVIARNVGIEPNSPHRVEAALDYALKEAGGEGHVYLEPKHIVFKLLNDKSGLIKASGVVKDDIRDANTRLVQSGKCVREGHAVYTKGLYEAEIVVAGCVRQMVSKLPTSIPTLDDMVDDIEQRDGIIYAPRQKDAVKLSLQAPLSIITGPPGSGKTTVINAICDIYETLDRFSEIYLAAPTGKAAKRMTEATGREAKTLHRLLGYNPELGFTLNAHNKLPGPALLIVDELSMVDIELASKLFPALGDDIQVILVGDVDQLQSVGPGNVLNDMIASGKIPVTRLAVNYRQQSGSKIIDLAAMICAGEIPPLVSENDVEIIVVDDGEEAERVIVAMLGDMAAQGVKPEQFQVLSPMYRNAAGIDRLNEAAGAMFTPPRDGEKKLGDYRVGSKVLVTKNNYSLEIMNGDTGIVRSLHIDGGSMMVDFGDFMRELTVEDLESVTLGWAVSVHKMQGSECKHIIMPVVTSHYMLLTRPVIYTAVTRAREKLTLVVQEKALKIAVNNNTVAPRFSKLAERIRGA